MQIVGVFLMNVKVANHQKNVLTVFGKNVAAGRQFILLDTKDMMKILII